MGIVIVYSPEHKLHNPKWEFFKGKKIPHSEISQRIETIKDALETRRLGEIIAPTNFSLEYIYAIHGKKYVVFIKDTSLSLKGTEAIYPKKYSIDTYTPILSGTYRAAKTAVDCVLTAARHTKGGEKFVYALCRPPGHHAETHRMGGYCYFNNAAVAAEYLSSSGKVAILDIDFHHGNGTQNIFYDRNDVLYVSIHADPNVKFPYFSGFVNERGVGEGTGFNKNYPLPLGTGERIYKKTLDLALVEINNYNPKFLIISTGFDTYIKDQIGGFRLTIPFFKIIGKEIESLNTPSLIVQEGGYNVQDLGKLAVSFLEGLVI